MERDSQIKIVSLALLILTSLVGAESVPYLERYSYANAKFDGFGMHTCSKVEVDSTWTEFNLVSYRCLDENALNVFKLSTTYKVESTLYFKNGVAMYVEFSCEKTWFSSSCLDTE